MSQLNLFPTPPTKQDRLILALTARAAGKPKLKAKIAKIKKKKALYDWLAQ